MAAIGQTLAEETARTGCRPKIVSGAEKSAFLVEKPSVFGCRRALRARRARAIEMLADV
jgi:hypothetical protein